MLPERLIERAIGHQAFNTVVERCDDAIVGQNQQLACTGVLDDSAGAEARVEFSVGVESQQFATEGDEDVPFGVKDRLAWLLIGALRNRESHLPEFSKVLSSCPPGVNRCKTRSVADPLTCGSATTIF